MTQKLNDIRFNLWSALQWKGSFIQYVFTFLFITLQYLTPVTFFLILVNLIFGKKIRPSIIRDVWILLVFFVQTIIFLNWHSYSGNTRSFFLFFSYYYLFDALCATMRDVLLAPNIHNGKIRVYNRIAWILVTFLTVIQVVLSFATIILFFGDRFVNGSLIISDASTAIYVSTITFTTLGYGDYVPTCSVSQAIVIGELFFFLLFLALKVPLAVGMIDVSDFDEANPYK